MSSIFETITSRLLEAWRSEEPSGRRSAFACRCGRPVYFNNSVCLGCNAPLGFEPGLLQVRAMTPAPGAGTFTLDGQDDDAIVWKRCANFESPAGCNWLVSADDGE